MTNEIVSRYIAIRNHRIAIRIVKILIAKVLEGEVRFSVFSTIKNKYEEL